MLLSSGEHSARPSQPIEPKNAMSENKKEAPKQNEQAGQAAPALAYTLAPTADNSSKLQKALAFRAQPGKVFAALLESGFSKDLWNHCIAVLAIAYAKAGKSPNELALALGAVSAENMSAARQAFGLLIITPVGEKPMSVNAYWEKKGKKAVAIDTSAVLDC